MMTWENSFLDIKKIKAYLSFSVRSGNIIFGVDKLMVNKKLPIVVLICSTQNDKVTNKVLRYCSDNNIKVIKLKDLLLADIIGRDNCKVVGLTDFNLAKAVMDEFQNGK